MPISLIRSTQTHTRAVRQTIPIELNEDFDNFAFVFVDIKKSCCVFFFIEYCRICTIIKFVTVDTRIPQWAQILFISCGVCAKKNKNSLCTLVLAMRMAVYVCVICTTILLIDESTQCWITDSEGNIWNWYLLKSSMNKWREKKFHTTTHSWKLMHFQSCEQSLVLDNNKKKKSNATDRMSFTNK